MKHSSTQPTPECTAEISAGFTYYTELMGIVNNAAWMACLDALEYARRHPNYNKQCKGGYTAHSEFDRTMKMFKAYRRNLIYGSDSIFHVSDIDPDFRECLKPDITDSEFYDFWEASGFNAYQISWPFFTCLENKNEQMFLKTGDMSPKETAWVTTAAQTLTMATTSFRTITDEAVAKSVHMCHTYGTRRTRMMYEGFFRQFDLSSVCKAWQRAALALMDAPDVTMEDYQARNIAQGYQQLGGEWLKPSNRLKTAVKTIDDYADLFRTGGYKEKYKTITINLYKKRYPELADEQV